MSRTQVTYSFLSIGCIFGLFVSRGDNSQEQRIQDPKKVIAEGFNLRDKLYASADKDKNRILSTTEKRSLLDLLDFERTFLDESSLVIIRPKIDGDSKLNIYFSHSTDGYVGTVNYAQAETALKKKK
ncbi:MAG: hypothetical protein AABX10_05340 [Nanoarchaeota archaeon]